MKQNEGRAGLLAGSVPDTGEIRLAVRHSRGWGRAAIIGIVPRRAYVVSDRHQAFPRAVYADRATLNRVQKTIERIPARASSNGRASDVTTVLVAKRRELAKEVEPQRET
jgi:hypothetical protein